MATPRAVPATGTVSADSSAEPQAPRSALPEDDPSSQAGDGAWSLLREQVANCTGCELHTTRTRTVFGVGATDAQLMLIGEAPGADEDQQGEPFVGAAGQLLNEMLRAIGLTREQVFIANILKCRPPRNRDPKPDEVVACQDYLRRQIALIQPRLIVAVGRIAAQVCLESKLPIGKLRGRVHTYGEPAVDLLATYHPAYLLRSPAEKRKAWQDLQRIRQLLRN